MKNIRALIFCLFTLTLFLSCESKSVKVGILHSKTGNMSMSENALIKAELLAIEEINNEGGLLGKRIIPIVEDGESNPDVFLEKAKKLLREDKVATIFGCWTSASRKAIKPLLEEDFGLLWYPIQYEGIESSPNIMYMGATPNQQIVPAIEYCVNHFGKNAYLIGSDYVFPQTANRIIKAELKNLNANVVKETYRTLGFENCLPIVEEIKELKPDFIVNTLNGSTNENFFKMLKENGIEAKDIPVMSFSISESEINKIGAEYLTGHYLAWDYFSTVNSPENEEFIKKYKEKYGEEEITAAPLEAAFIAVKMWALAVQKAQSFDVEAVRIASKGLKYEAPAGSVEIDGTNQHTYKKIRIGKINDSGLIDIVWESEESVKPDPYLSEYIWAKGL